MTEKKLAGDIVGGPLDGSTFTYESAPLDDSVLNEMDKVVLEGHTYKIIEFDKEKMHMVVMW